MECEIKADLAALDNLLRYDFLKSHQNSRENLSAKAIIEVESLYDFHIGLFIYLYSIASKQSLECDFRETRNNIVHSLWGIKHSGGYALTNRNDIVYPFLFTDINDLINLNTDLRHSINKIPTDSHTKSHFHDEGDLHKYLVTLGNFVREFSCLENTIQACLYRLEVYFGLSEDNESSFNKLHAKEALKRLARIIKDSNGNFQEKIKEFDELNTLRHSLFHAAWQKGASNSKKRQPIQGHTLKKHLNTLHGLSQSFMHLLHCIAHYLHINKSII